MLKTALSMLACLCLASVSQASAPTINVGSHSLLPNQADQTVQIYVTGGALVQGLEFNVQIGDGTAGPMIQNVDIFTGTIFALSNDGLFPGSYVLPRLAYQGTTTDETEDIGFGPGFISTTGLLATLTLDTTGIVDGEFGLNLVGTDEGDTNFAGVFANVTNGTLAIPEPITMTMLLLGSGALLVGRRRS